MYSHLFSRTDVCTSGPFLRMMHTCARMQVHTRGCQWLLFYNRALKSLYLYPVECSRNFRGDRRGNHVWRHLLNASQVIGRKRAFSLSASLVYSAGFRRPIWPRGPLPPPDGLPTRVMQTRERCPTIIIISLAAPSFLVIKRDLLEYQLYERDENLSFIHCFLLRGSE